MKTITEEKTTTELPYLAKSKNGNVFLVNGEKVCICVHAVADGYKTGVISNFVDHKQLETFNGIVKLSNQ